MKFRYNIKKYLFEIIKINSILKIIYTVIIFLAVFITVDHFNLLSFILKYFNFATSIILFLIVLILALENKLIKLFFLKTVNSIEYFNMALFISSLILAINYIIEGEKLKSIVFICILIVTIFLLFIRFIIVSKKNINKKDVNVLDMNDVICNKFESENLTHIFIDECDVSYDLLNRTSIIEDIYNLVSNCNNIKPYVFSLKGNWGSGKSTIINNVIRKINENNNENIIIIDNFNPWIYSDEKSIFKAMVEVIFEKIGISVTRKNIKKYVNIISGIIFKDTNQNFFINSDELEDLEDLRKFVNKYLKETGKKVFFVIDNIERSKAENILIVLKTINSILNFERIVYLVSYDEKEMREVFEKKLNVNYDYLEKIINHEFEVPKVTYNQMFNLSKKVVVSILKYYKFEDKKINEYKQFITQLANSENIRELKRTINSSLSLNIHHTHYLNIFDYLAMKYLSVKDNKLYNSIYSNRKYFVSEDYHVYKEDISYDNKQYNKDCFYFFENTLELKKNIQMLDFLAEIFPNVMTYKLNIFDQEPEFRPTGTYVISDDNRNKRSNLEKRIFNGKYFDLYFNSDSNEFITYSKKIENFIDLINTENTNNNIINDNYLELIDLQTDSIQKYIIDTLEYYLNDVDNFVLLFNILYSNYYKLNNDFIFLSLNARSKCIVILAHILKLSKPENVEEIIISISKDYNRIYIVSQILYWLSPKRNATKYSSSEIYDKLNEIYNNMKLYIVNNNIDIYSEKFYALNNINCFENSKENNLFIKQFINEKTIFKFLGDLISYSLSTEYSFRIKKSALERYITIDEVDKLLKNAKISNEKEKIIKEIYDKTINDDDEFSVGYTSEEFIDYDLTRV